MQMDSRIILAGQTPDIAGSAMRGVQLAQGVNDTRRANALAQLYQDQGAGIIAGDQNALNALAGFDPGAALGVKGTLQTQEYARNGEGRASTRFGWDVEDRVAKMSAQEAAAEAEALRNAVAVAATIETPEQWDAFMASKGLENLVGTFGNREQVLTEYMGLTEFIEAEKGLAGIRGGGEEKFRMATPEEAAQYGAAGGQFGPDGKFYPINPPSGMSIRQTPEGGFEMIQGAGAGKSFTEGQGKDVVYATRAEGALAKLEPIAGALTSRAETVADMVPLGLGAEIQTPEYQVARTSGQEFLQAILRKDTGAAITKSEEDQYGSVYLPQPGDGTERLAYKAEARRRAVAALKAGMNPQQILAMETALSEGGRSPGGQVVPASPPPAQGQGVAMSPEQIKGVISGLSESERTSFMSMPREQQLEFVRRRLGGAQ